MGTKQGITNILACCLGSTPLSKVCLGTGIVWQKEEEISETIITTNYPSIIETCTLNLYKLDVKPTKIYINNTLVHTTTTSGTQDITLTNVPVNATIKIENTGRWYFDDQYMLVQDTTNLGPFITNVDMSNEHRITKMKGFTATRISSIVIPESATSIEELAFNASYLTSINIPDNITTIGDQAFVGCSYLTTIFIGRGITEITRTIFRNSKNIQSVSFAANSRLTRLGDGTVNSGAFDTCTIGSISLPDSIEGIDKYSFYNCTIGSISLPNKPIFISKDAFYISSILFTEDNGLYAKTTTSNYDIYRGASSGATEVTIKNGCRFICSAAHSGNTTCKTVSVPSTVIIVGATAFANTNSSLGITSITFNQPAGMVVTFGGAVFDCKTASSLTVYTDNEYVKNYNYSGDNVTATFYHLDGTPW